MPKRSACSTIITVALGTSMPTSITLVATSTSSLPEAKRSITSRLRGDGICPCITSTAEVAQNSVFARRSASSVAARACERLRLLDQRADHIALAPFRQALADELVGAGALVLAHRPGLDRLAAGRQLAQRRRVQIAVERQRQRARDRRRGQVQQVRRQLARRLGVERRALAHAEAMLLVDHRQRQALEVDRRPRSARGCRPAASARPTPAARGSRAARARRSSRSATPPAGPACVAGLSANSSIPTSRSIVA